MKRLALTALGVVFSILTKAQLLQSFTQENWMIDTWQNANRTLYFYDENENQSYSEYYNWNSGNQEFQHVVTETNYRNQEGLIDSTVLNVYNFSMMQFNPSTKIEYEYNQNNQTVSVLNYSFSNGAFIPSSLRTYTYDVNGFTTETQFNLWDSENEVWINSSRTEFSPTATGQIALEVSFLFSQDLQQWLESSRTSYTYNAIDKVQERITESFMSGLWVNASRNNFEYDALGNLVFETGDVWNNSQSVWRISFRTNYTNTSFNKVSQFLSEFWSSDDWVNGVRGTYVYSEPSGIKETSAHNIFVFPNPSNDYIQLNTFATCDIEILDALGNRVTTIRNYRSGEQINTVGFGSGVYILNVKSPGEVSSVRWIKSE